MKVKPKTKRNNNILEYVKRGYTYQNIAKIFHITKGRVGQIVKANKEER